MPRFPALFLAHGHPMNALESNRYTRSWQALAEPLPRPRAILAVSAHWCDDGLMMTDDEHPPTLHDFSGFPETLYRFQYPCPGSPWLNRRLTELLPAPPRPITGRGLDHGVWCALAHLYPDASIPVVQLSLDATRATDDHWHLARHLTPLRDEGVLLLASGNIVHNIARWRRDPEDADWAMAFDSRVRDAIAQRDWETLMHYSQLPHADAAVPHPDHYWPLLYPLATADSNEPIMQTALDDGSLADACMRSLRVGP